MNRDISNWGWGQILELPDHLFGRRFVVAANAFSTAIGEYFAISDMGLPEKIVVWSVRVMATSVWSTPVQFRLCLGDHLPANAAEFIPMESLFPDVGVLAGGVRLSWVSRYQTFEMNGLKMGVDTAGRRLVTNSISLTTEDLLLQAVVVVSSVPRSIPECYA